MLGIVYIFSLNFNKQCVFAAWWTILKEPRVDIIVLWAAQQKLGFIFGGFTYTKGTIIYIISVLVINKAVLVNTGVIDSQSKTNQGIPKSFIFTYSKYSSGIRIFIYIYGTNRKCNFASVSNPFLLTIISYSLLANSFFYYRRTGLTIANVGISFVENEHVFHLLFILYTGNICSRAQSVLIPSALVLGLSSGCELYEL